MSGAAQSEGDDDPFALKPFDKQDQNNDDDSDDGDIAVKTDDPPEWFLEDHEGHPLADSYRVFGFLADEIGTVYKAWHTEE